MTACATLPALARYPIGLADDALVLAQRCGEWITRAPQLEEDVALANIGLDLLGQARALLTYAAQVEGAGRDEDDLAYLRDERDFLNCQLVELENGDFAVSMARLLVFSAYSWELYSRLQRSTDETLAAIAAKAIKEVDYHRDHATEWVLRLGDGTELSHERMQTGLETVWPYVDELFTTTSRHGTWPDADVLDRGAAVDPGELREPTMAYVQGVIAQATLDVPTVSWTATGGRHGIHSSPMGHLLAELQHIHRSHPGATW
ncbi:MAG TPA: 1,2-phenylacetyl-CoA epoxidase subunit PaaC [Actinomycetales bacterium]|nr:1,2-phenylacetyl-CoA epoxidase subunit PaaC [Actinomycetales bacterium]